MVLAVFWICQVVLAKKKKGREILSTILTVPTYVEDFYTVLKVDLSLILLMPSKRGVDHMPGVANQ